MNSIIETVENKIKPKPQFINEKISKILSLKKKTELSIDGFSRIQFHVWQQILLLIKEYRLHGTDTKQKL